VKAEQEGAHGEADRGHHPVIGPVGAQIEAEGPRAHHAAEPALAARERGPAIGDGEEHRGQRERQEREIDAAPPQDQRSEEGRCDRDEEEREERRKHDALLEPVQLAQGCGIGPEAEPGAVPERDEAGMPDEDVQPHAGDREDDDVDRRAEGQAEDIEHEGQHDERGCQDGERPEFPAHRPYSNFWMRSPNSPRGRRSRTRAIKRYIEASPAGGKK
jgi:hypothetical protein